MRISRFRESLLVDEVRLHRGCDLKELTAFVDQLRMPVPAGIRNVSGLSAAMSCATSSISALRSW